MISNADVLPKTDAYGTTEWHTALGLLNGRQRIMFALLTGARAAVGLCDLLLAGLIYVLFLLLQGRVPSHFAQFVPKSTLTAACFASILVVVRALLDVLTSRLAFRQIQTLSTDFLLRLTEGYSLMDWRRFVERNRSELSNHALHTAREAADFYHRCIEMVSGVLTIAVMGVAMIYQSATAALVFAFSLVVFYGLHRFLVRRSVRTAASDHERSIHILVRNLADLFLAGKEVRAYRNYSFFRDRIRQRAEQAARSNQRVVFLPQVSRTIADQGTMILFLAVIVAVEWQYGDTRQLISVLAFYFVLSRRLLPLVSQLAMIAGQMEASYEHVRILASELAECRRFGSTSRSFDPPSQGLVAELVQVSFWYSSAAPVLRNVNLSVRQGECIVLHGPSGSGKSSLLNLVAGVLPPAKGKVCVDHKKLAYVPQEVPLLDESLRSNLLFGLPVQSDDQLMRALAVARLDKLVAALPDGLDTQVGDNGALFSGGERQRLGIARAVLRCDGLLLLDEATSSLDSENEQRILENLRALGHSIVMATHRTHGQVIADRVFHIEAGRLVEKAKQPAERGAKVSVAIPG